MYPTLTLTYRLCVNLVKWTTRIKGSFQISHFLVAFTKPLQLGQNQASSFFFFVNRFKQLKSVVFCKASELTAHVGSSITAYTKVIPLLHGIVLTETCAVYPTDIITNLCKLYVPALLCCPLTSYVGNAWQNKLSLHIHVHTYLPHAPPPPPLVTTPSSSSSYLFYSRFSVSFFSSSSSSHFMPTCMSTTDIFLFLFSLLSHPLFSPALSIYAISPHPHC